ncbi:tubulin polyglutamylase [Plasmopara halstedii]|uniref:Tubulin polyglutamylase n=1 Tax=Plasmopara halstedii TaxID=4781 RepID=A0A0P1ALJ4_PLAHL|nr:tubulin polyglutamylase [Plasmopara halstedii]CEG42174.1 tubulin polyglutamylase [Plasmopara halstedii]|eukprot:XP_024578543.1 tubulin polyglutamylase [Plasmopara halstedii]
MTKRDKKRVRINVTLCRYEVVRRVARARGWKLVTDERPDSKLSACNVHWIDVPDILPTFTGLLPYQKVNHFPGMANLACKSKLARNLERMKKLFPDEFNFVPRTWILPFDKYDFQQNFNAEGLSQRTFIVKPDHMCQGRGVFLTRNLAQIPRGDVLVAQQYVARPLLIDGKKFDLRIYVLVTSCSPLRVYIFNDGLVRMCTADYVTPNADNLEQRFMHLTNYAVNKHSSNFETNKGDNAEGTGSKRSLKWFFSWLKERLASDKVDRLWDQIGDICLKTILSVQPTLAQEYKSTFSKNLRRTNSASRSGPRACDKGDEVVENRGKSTRPGSANDAGNHINEPFSTSSSAPLSCSFALLGMDVLIDEKLKPWLLEVNHLPSFGCDSLLDWSVKEPLISQTFDILNITSSAKKRFETEQARELQHRLYGGAATGKFAATSKVDNQIDSLPPLIISSQREDTSEAANKIEKENQLPLKSEQLRQALTDYYAHFNSERLHHLDTIMSKYADNQKELNRSLQQKYGKGIRDFASIDSIATNAQQQNQNVGHVLDEEKLIDFARLYPPSSDADRALKYRKMLAASQQYIDELQLRFSAPLQHRRPELDSDGVALPLLNGAQRKEHLGRDCFGFAGTDRGKLLSAADRKPLVIPGPMQVAAAHRLMLGHSSQKLSIKPPTPPEPILSRSSSPLNYGLQYRERILSHKNKPTLSVSQVSFRFDGPF